MGLPRRHRFELITTRGANASGSGRVERQNHTVMPVSATPAATSATATTNTTAELPVSPTERVSMPANQVTPPLCRAPAVPNPRSSPERDRQR